MKVAIVSGARSDVPMGLELAEQRLFEALRAAETQIHLDVRVVGGRAARVHARRVRGRWIPALPNRPWTAAWAGADVVHLIGLDLPPPRHKPFVATVHDLSPLHYEDEGSLPPWMEEIADRATLLLTPSAFTASELHEHLGVPREQIQVYGGAPALDARYAEPLTQAELHGLGIEPPFVLRYGGYTARKNVPLLLEAWPMVPTGTLVLVGPLQRPLEATFSAVASLDRVVVLGYLPQATLARLLRSAALLVSTSQYEGFGLPPTEALAAGTPVVAVATPFAREVCGEAAILVPRDPAAVAAAICRVIDDPHLAGALRTAGARRASNLTWESAADEVLSAYAQAGRQPSAHLARWCAAAREEPSE